MECKALESGDKIEHPEGSLRWNAQQLLTLGKPDAIREVADRLDGKVPQSIGGSDELPPVGCIVTGVMRASDTDDQA